MDIQTNTVANAVSKVVTITCLNDNITRILSKSRKPKPALAWSIKAWLALEPYCKSLPAHR